MPSRLGGWLLLAAIVLWQGWITFTLFGPEHHEQHLLDRQPIISGKHALHLYHGYLAARAFQDHGTLSSYDPAFQAGYPQTPIFDNGSRPAAFFQTLAGSEYSPQAYKLGLALSCLAIPLFLYLAGRGAGISAAGSCLAALGAVLAFWSTPGRQMLEAGDLHIILTAAAVVLQLGLLNAVHRGSSLRAWLGLFAASTLAWFAEPSVAAAGLVLVVISYLSIAKRHRAPWHIALAATVGGSIFINWFWLGDWFHHWWIRSGLSLDMPLLSHRTMHTIWSAPLWGDEVDRTVAVSLLALAMIGAWCFPAGCPAGPTCAIGGVTFLILAAAGVACEPLGRLGGARLLVPGLWFLSVPAAHAVSSAGAWLVGHLSGWLRGLVAAALLLGMMGMASRAPCRTILIRFAGTDPFRIGLEPEDGALVETLAKRTSGDSRILWEDEMRGDYFWTPLLPVLTGRAYLGGLDPDRTIEHSYATLVNGNLAGRSIASWSDADLEDFCRRYNIGWIVCSSSASTARLRSRSTAGGQAIEVGNRLLVPMPSHSFALKGQARLLQADSEHIALGDLVPQDGKVVLSLHYHAGIRASPSRVKIEREPDPADPIPFIRLQLTAPLARVTLRWD
jgi:hypothetical protein